MSTRDLPRHLRIDAVESPAQQLRLFGAGAGRIFASYEQWEDYRAGMFDSRITDTDVATCRSVLRDEGACREAMERVIQEWPIATAVNLTNSGANRRAWLGQAACCLHAGATSSATKRAWWQLSTDHQTAANVIAEEVIALWEQTRE